METQAFATEGRRTRIPRKLPGFTGFSCNTTQATDDTSGHIAGSSAGSDEDDDDNDDDVTRGEAVDPSGKKKKVLTKKKTTGTGAVSRKKPAAKKVGKVSKADDDEGTEADGEEDTTSVSRQVKEITSSKAMTKPKKAEELRRILAALPKDDLHHELVHIVFKLRG
jgi:hypothetical protein